MTYAEEPQQLIARSSDTSPSIAIKLILAQYRMSRIEEIVTNNVFRIIWFAFSVYLSSTTIDIDSANISREAPWFVLLRSFAMLLVGGVIYITSRGAKNYTRRQSTNLRSLLVSSDDKRKDVYVRESYRDEIRESHFTSRTLLSLEDLLWFCAIAGILYVRVAGVLAY